MCGRASERASERSGFTLGAQNARQLLPGCYSAASTATIERTSEMPENEVNGRPAARLPSAGIQPRGQAGQTRAEFPRLFRAS